MKTFYITTTLPYVNADPHIGFALEIIQADVIARFHRLKGEDVVFNTGTDEHGLKIYRKAKEENKDCQDYCDEYAAKFDALKDYLNLSYTNFIRTTDKHHMSSAQEFWKKCLDNGDIYKKKYKVRYCVGCELEKTDSELADGKCPVHPSLNLEEIEEENYFFRFSKYQKALLDFYNENKDFVVPEHRFNEIKAFVQRGLQDFSISRLKEKMPWGVLVPNDEEQVMYVWFDALINYISTIGWPDDAKKFKKYWPTVQVAGKDNLRQQTAMWQAMLFSAGIPASKQIFIHGFITSEGQKMSKTLGNIVNPLDIVKKYGTDAVRFYLLGALPSYDDGDFSFSRFEEYYTANLANGVGNLTSRIITMLEKYSESKIPAMSDDIFDTASFWKDYKNLINNFDFEKAVELTNNFVKKCDLQISEKKPWEKAKAGEDILPFLYQLAEALRHIGTALYPFIPSSSEKILNQMGIDITGINDFKKIINWGGLKKGSIIKKGDILFPKL
jgi:methionyl-tRNA synthetase